MKIRTDFVTNSSSSSYVTLNVEMKNGGYKSVTWNSGNIDLEWCNDYIDFSKEFYESLKTGNDLLEICYNYADEVSSKHRKDHNCGRGDLEGDVEGILKIQNIKEEVNSVTFQTYKESWDEPVYNAENSYNYKNKIGRCKVFEENPYYGGWYCVLETIYALTLNEIEKIRDYVVKFSDAEIKNICLAAKYNKDLRDDIEDFYIHCHKKRYFSDVDGCINYMEKKKTKSVAAAYIYKNASFITTKKEYKKCIKKVKEANYKVTGLDEDSSGKYIIVYIKPEFENTTPYQSEIRRILKDYCFVTFADNDVSNKYTAYVSLWGKVNAIKNDHLKLDSSDLDICYPVANIHGWSGEIKKIKESDEEEPTVRISRKGKIAYGAGTFEDDFYNPAIEKLIIDIYNEFSPELKKYVIDYFNNNYILQQGSLEKFNLEESGKSIYEYYARFLGEKGKDIKEIRNPKVYTSILEFCKQRHFREERCKLFSEPELLICKGLSFAAIEVGRVERDIIKRDVTERGGYYTTAVSGETNVLISDSETTTAKGFYQALDNIKEGKNTILITYKHYVMLKKTGSFV